MGQGGLRAGDKRAVPGPAAGAPTLVILHTNDIHGQMEAGAACVGFERVQTLAARCKEHSPAVLLLDAGDALHGSVPATVSQGAAVLEGMCRAGYDAITPGNHDFNYGLDRLKELQAAYPLPFLAGNVVHEETGCKVFEAVRFFEWEGLRAGVFGVATPETKTKSNPGNTRGHVFMDVLAYVRRCVRELKTGGADVIICLSHLGMDADSQWQDKHVAQAVPGIDVIVGGHSHDRFESGVTVGDTLIVQAGSYFSAVGEVRLMRQADGSWQKQATLHRAADVPMPAAAKPLPETVHIMQKQAPVLSTYVGESREPLNGERLAVRSGETNFGSLMADAMRAATGADVAIMNGGGIRCSIAQGRITMRDIMDAFPFSNVPSLLEVSGATIWTVLAHGFSTYPQPAGHFPHVSGMTCAVAEMQAKRKCLQEIWVHGRPIQLDKRYRLAVNDFMAAGGDGYDMLVQQPQFGSFGALSEVLAGHINGLKQVPVYREQRIRLIEPPAARMADPAFREWLRRKSRPVYAS